MAVKIEDIRTEARIVGLDVDAMEVAGYRFIAYKKNGAFVSRHMTIGRALNWLGGFIACIPIERVNTESRVVENLGRALIGNGNGH